MRSWRIGRSSDVNLWRIPLEFSLASLALFGLTMIPDVLDARGAIHLPDWFTMGGIDDARAILSAMLSCVSTVLALIFSVALLVLSMVATLFGPRLLYRFLQDWVTQATIGLFMATFIYLCLVFLVTHSDCTFHLHSGSLSDHELVARDREFWLPDLLQPSHCRFRPESGYDRAHRR